MITFLYFSQLHIQQIFGGDRKRRRLLFFLKWSQEDRILVPSLELVSLEDKMFPFYETSVVGGEEQEEGEEASVENQEWDCYQPKLLQPLLLILAELLH